jgi:hypothetical protein
MALDFNSLPTNLGELLAMAEGPRGFAPGVQLRTSQVPEAPVPAPPPQPAVAQAPPPATATPSTQGAPPSVGGGLKEAWKGYIQRLQNDPNLRMAIMQTGIGLMQSKQMGQNNWDIAGNALNRGVSTLELMRERDRKKAEEEKVSAREDKKLALDEQRTGAQVEASRASTRASNIQSTVAEEQLTPEYAEMRRRMVELGIDEKQAEIAAKKAQAEAYRAQADKDRRTDPNATGGGSAGGFDARAAEARSAELVAQGMDPVQAKAQAYREQTEEKRAKDDVYRQQKALSEKILQIDPLYPYKTPQEQADVRARALKEFQQEEALYRDRQAKANEDANAQHLVGSSVTVMKTDPKTGQKVAQQAKVINIAGGRATLQLPDGSQTWVPTPVVVSEAGKRAK